MSIIKRWKSSNYSFFIFVLIIISASIGCTNSLKNNSKDNLSVQDDSVLTEYSKHLKIIRSGNQRFVQVINPWQGADNVMYQYKIDHPGDTTSSNEEYISIPENPEKIIVFSTTHLAMLDFLDKSDRIVGMSGANYAYNAKIIQKFQEGNLTDIGFDRQINYELAYSLKPDLVILFIINYSGLDIVRKFEQLGVPVLINADYLETNALGRAEWIKLFGLIFNDENAFSYFDYLKGEYAKTQSLTKNIQERPVVLEGLPFNGIWYASGGDSYLSGLIYDAGGEYIWSKFDTDIKALNLETVYTYQKQADVWINPGSAKSLGEILQTDQRIGNFTTFKNQKVFNNIKRLGEFGGNDYYESGILNPHLILKDLIRIIHPEIETGSEFFYYAKLE